MSTVPAKQTSDTAPAETVEERFRRLEATWLAEVGYSSSSIVLRNHPTFQEIIGMHPLLCHAFLKFFVESCPGACQQMVVTTHETHLLDQDLLRRDEIWFAEKDQEEQTRLYSLADMKVRNDVRLEKGYLQGRFGAIPFIGDTKKLKDLIQCPTKGKKNAKKRPLDRTVKPGPKRTGQMRR